MIGIQVWYLNINTIYLLFIIINRQKAGPLCWIYLYLEIMVSNFLSLDAEYCS